MGKKEKTVRKVVLDTNILISAILFKGELMGIVDLWKRGKIVPVVSRETFNEFRKVLEYRKFRLTKGEIKTIMEEEVFPRKPAARNWETQGNHSGIPFR